MYISLCLTRSNFYFEIFFCFQFYKMSYLLNGLFVTRSLCVSLSLLLTHRCVHSDMRFTPPFFTLLLSFSRSPCIPKIKDSMVFFSVARSVLEQNKKKIYYRAQCVCCVRCSVFTRQSTQYGHGSSTTTYFSCLFYCFTFLAERSCNVIHVHDSDCIYL